MCSYTVSACVFCYRSEWPPDINKSAPEPCSSDRHQVDWTESDLQLNRPLEPEHGAKNESRDGSQANAGFDRGRGHYNVLEEDDSILVCVTSRDREARSGTATPDGEVAASRTELQSPRRPEDEWPVLCGSTCESAPRVSASTQTEEPVAVDKQVNTEVYMADLDYVVVRFQPHGLHTPPT